MPRVKQIRPTILILGDSDRFIEIIVYIDLTRYFDTALLAFTDVSIEIWEKIVCDVYTSRIF